MPALTINGITVAAQISSGRHPQSIIIGDDGRRTQSGAKLSTVRARKQVLEFKTIPQPQATAAALRALLEGQGYSWSFDSDSYSDGKGLGPSSGAVTSEASGKYGNRGSVATGVSAVYAVGGAYPATLLAWKLLGDGATWQHYALIQTAAGVGTVYRNAVQIATEGVSEWLYYDGSNFALRAHDVYAATWQTAHVYGPNSVVKPTTPNGRWYRTTAGGTAAVGEPTWPTTYGNTVVDGTVTWIDQGVVALKVDDAVFLPYAIPTSWVAMVFAEMGARAWTPNPKLRCTGDLTNSVARTMQGTVGGATFRPHFSGGSYQRAGEELEFRLEEV